MECLIGTRSFKIEEPTVVTIGKFDGRHKGHQKLLGQMLELKRQYGYKTAVYTFEMAPAAVVRHEFQSVITTNEERRINMADMGIDYLVEYPFTEEVAHMPPDEFIKVILVEQMHAKAIVVGPDCGFGYQRSGNVDLLRQFEKKYGYQLFVIEKEQQDQRDISSTYIKEQLQLGHIEKVHKLLGRPYSISGEVVHGNHIGGPKLGFPTVNIITPPEKLLPPFGVYVSRVIVNDKVYGGITNIGRKPTIDEKEPIGVETYLFDFDENIYGTIIEVQLLNFRRPERKFENFEQLKQQIADDQQYGKEYLNKYLNSYV